jgi:glycosyltransferase involved in cell wall biosynthesis
MQEIGARQKLRVRVGRNHEIRYNIIHGQRNADFILRPTNPLKRINKRLDSISIVGSGYDLIHNFNSIPLFTSCPFVVTFEDYAPRLPEDRPISFLSSHLRRRLVSNQCVSLVAMSLYAMRQMKQQHRTNGSDLAKLVEKSEVVYPGIRVTRNSPKSSTKSPLKLLFVGGDFFRKGGPALVRAHKMLRKSGIAVQTTVVSSLAWSLNDYVGPPDPCAVKEYLRELETDGITHHPQLSGEDVQRVMQQADFLVLPTLHDTFGYVSIEAMAAGTPVIATATCAQPEIVEDNQSGFLLNFDNDTDVGKWKWLYGQKHPQYTEAYRSTINSLAQLIAVRIQSFYEIRSDYERLSAGALARIQRKFSVERARDSLEKIYYRVYSI